MSGSSESREQVQEDQLDRLFNALANERRLQILLYLDGKDGDVASFTELIDHVIVHEAESIDDLEDDSAAIALYHIHLPILEDAGLIEYDERSQTVRYRDESRVKPHLKRVAQGERA